MQSHCKEIWKPIPKYEGLYLVSNCGNVKSVDRIVSLYDPRWQQVTCHKIKGQNRIPGIRSGYPSLMLSKRGKTRSHDIHRLVLAAFVGPCPEGMEACHNDGNKRNNRVENLRWDTRRNNHHDKISHGTSLCGEKNPRACLTEDNVKRIRKYWNTGCYKQRELGNMFGIAQVTVSQIVLRKRWAYL